MKVYDEGKTELIEKYSEICLRRIWDGERFSWWMSNMLHKFEETSDFNEKMYNSEIEYYLKSDAGRRVIAEQYVGLPFDKVE